MTKRAITQAATKAKITAVAACCFEAIGYERTTLRYIARAAGLSTGAVFANFSGKEALYAEIYGRPPISPEVARELLEALCRISLGSPDDAPPFRAMGPTQMQEVARAAIRLAVPPEVRRQLEAAE